MKTNDYSLFKKSFEDIPLNGFNPNSYEEYRCKEIATALGETSMNYLLKVLRRNGYGVIERAWGLYKEAREAEQTIRNPPAYFNGIITNLINNTYE